MNYSMGIFTDLSKAFDIINHNKLEYYAIRSVALKWFICYLSNRSKFVQTGDICCSCLHLTC